MSWVIAVSHCVNSHVLRAVINTGGKKKADALLCEDRNKLVGSTGFALVPSVTPSGFCCKSWNHLGIHFYTCLAKLFYVIFRSLCYCMQWNNRAIGNEIFYRCLLSLLAI